MDTPTPARIVVGVDATPASDAGVDYAAREAQLCGAELDIVHATPGYGDTDGDLPKVDDHTLASYGHKLLADAADVARTSASQVTTRQHLISGGAVSTLVSWTRGARLLVLGAERRSVLGRIWTGDVVAGAAARAHCPVVVVAPEWDPHQTHGRVVVAWKSAIDGAALVEAGLATAHEHGSELHIVHAWRLPSGYDDIIADRVATGDYQRRATADIENALQEHRDRFPDVDVSIHVVHAQPAFVLVDASSSADRLLISRPVHGGRVHHLGAVGRAVLQECRCPVQIVEPSTA